jgi:hypothetical protein
VIGHEADLAWDLALAAKPHLNVVERNGVFVAIGAGETFAVVTALVKWFAIKRIFVEPDLVRQCVSWLDGYVGHEDERYLRRLIEESSAGRRHLTPTPRGLGAATSGGAAPTRAGVASDPGRSAVAASSPGLVASPHRPSAPPLVAQRRR